MLPKRSVGTTRSLLFINAVLLSSAVALPAFAQVEEVVVTAQRKSENIQNVPIQVTAFSAEDLQAHQITMAKDLQFATPNINYTKTNFGGDDFTIRGIGNDVISGGGESAVSVSFDNIYIAGAVQNLGAYYDLDRVEVLEGPQSSLYGRGAAGGSVNLIPKKPDLETFSVEADASYGNYAQNQDHLMINLPLVTDELGFRLAVDREYNNGLVTNDFDNGHIDSNNTWAVRGTLRWQPTSNTTIDFLLSSFSKSDSSMRAQRQQCLYDPSGTLGCLPGGLANDSINENAFFSADLVSVQGLAGAGLGGLAPLLGLSNLQQQAPLEMNPSQPFTVNTDFTPTYQAQDDFMAVNWKQHIVSWLDFEGNFGYDHGDGVTQESYNNGASAPIAPPFSSCNATPVVGLPCFNGLGTYGPSPVGYSVEGNLYDLMSGLFPVFPGASPAYAAQFAPYFNAVPGKLPASNFNALGISTNPAFAQYYTNTYSTYDEDRAYQSQFSLDARFTSNLKGPVNFMFGGFYLRQEGWGDYYVSSGAQGYASVMLGALSGLPSAHLPTGVPGCFPAPGCTLATVFYDNRAPQPDGVTLKSKSAYGEVYWDIVPDLWKLTIGGRWTDDFKSQQDRITLINGLVPIGDANINDPVLAFANPAACPVCAPPANLQEYQALSQNFISYTGRAVLQYTPKLDFSDQTQIYASFARGYKAGGFNPGLSNFATSQGIAATYRPEGIDAMELGTKNTFLGSTLQANLDGWFYNYEGLQISQILYNDSINANVNSHMYGAEGNFIYAPDEHWAFNLNFGYTHSSLGANTALVDPRNPTAGQAGVVLIKDDTPTASAAQNCAVYLLPAAHGVAPADNPAVQAAFPGVFAAPPGGSAALAADGIPLSNYGSCNPAFFNNPAVAAVLGPLGYTYGTPAQAGGVAKNLGGKENPYSPPFTVSLGVQYTFNLWGEYSLVPRVDMAYIDAEWDDVFEDAADRIPGYFHADAQVQLNSPDNMWYLQGYVKNIFNKTYVTGQYLTSSSSGLYTNQFLGDPRMYGVRFGIKF